MHLGRNRCMSQWTNTMCALMVNNDKIVDQSTLSNEYIVKCTNSYWLNPFYKHHLLQQLLRLQKLTPNVVNVQNICFGIILSS